MTMRWEYNIITLKWEQWKDAVNILNVQGKKGWEVYHVYDSEEYVSPYQSNLGSVTIASSPTHYKNFLLKRQIVSPNL